MSRPPRPDSPIPYALTPKGRSALPELELIAIDEVLAQLPEYPNEAAELRGGPKLSRANRIRALIREADENAGRAVRSSARYREVLRALERAVEALEAVRKANHRRGHAACDEVLPSLRKTLSAHARYP